MHRENLKHIADGSLKIMENRPDREMYSHDIGDVPPVMTKTLFDTLPHLVVQPRSIEEIKAVLVFADANRMPIIPRGAASWGFGGVIPTRSGIVVDLSPFRRIIALDIRGKTVTVEAGARWSDIDIAAKLAGLCLMTYPSSKFSTVGGWISTGGYGINSFRYGHISRQIVSLTVMLPSGEARTLLPTDPDFAFFISTEGEFGIIVEATLRLRDVPLASCPRLFYCADDVQAFRFIEQLIIIGAALGIRPNTIRFLDRNHLHDTNEIIHARIFRETSAVLVEFGSNGDEQAFMRSLPAEGMVEAPSYASSYLWNERLFGMKTKRLGPTILASEVVIPIERAAAFIARAKKLGAYYGVEICVDSYILDERKALIMTTFLCDSRRLKYYVNLPLVSMLTQMAVSMGAAPYGLGIWNAPFIHHLFDRRKIAELRAFKAVVDPHHIMNPGKFFRVTSKWLNIPAAVFLPAVFTTAMKIMIFGSPIMGRLFTLLLGKEEKVDRLDIELSTHACAKCGNCMAVCPSYLVTGNEAVTAKGKLALAQKLILGKEVTREEAENAFLCMHCKACEDICQTNLEQMNLWDALEARLEQRFGRPEAKITAFLRAVDESKEYWETVERNALSH